ncbi:MAG TPA: hypothetical protein VMF89_20610 [Polyangiales bacterium]|nr:hypothetical protein [Polyangiales bacterium]
MQLVDRIEKRRFVGREFLLWLWFESEIFDATLATREHGEVGLWLESRLLLSQQKESTRIVAPSPGLGIEAKAALRRGQLPQSAGIRIFYKEAETRLTLNAERLAITGLRLATVLDQEEEAEPVDLVAELQGKTRGKGKKQLAEAQAELEAEHDAEVFYERMRLTTEIEEILVALYRDFLTLRLHNAWNQTVMPLLKSFAAGKAIDAEAYAAVRKKVLRNAKA